MRKLRTILCLLVLALTIPAAYCLRPGLPQDRQPMIEKKYGGWSGVLRLWVREGGLTGSAAWLNRCVASFEKRHPGVFVQPEYVGAGALTAEGLLPPDLILFPPGEIDGGGLAELSLDVPLRSGLPWDARAVPVLLSGYMWAWNAALLDGIPNSWRDAGVNIAVPADAPYRQWSAALLALCSSKYAVTGPQATTAPIGEMELGLARDDSEAMPSPTPAQGTLDCLLPEGFAPSDDAWREFINGDAAALLVGPREIRRLQALSEQGQGPDWRLGAAGDAAFTDQVLYIGATQQDDAEKLALCRDFIAHLLGDACQVELHRIGACSVTGADSGYASGDDLAVMEHMLGALPLVVPAPFDQTWRTDAEAIARQFLEGREPASLLERLRVRLRQ